MKYRTNYVKVVYKDTNFKYTTNILLIIWLKNSAYAGIALKN